MKDFTPVSNQNKIVIMPNDLPAEDINRNPTRPFGSAMEAYWASKAFARSATLDYIKEKQPKFDIVNLLPSVVIGPDERIPIDGSVDELIKENRAAVLAPALTSSLNSPFPFVGVPVHVADVARAHIDATNERLVPGNSEYILSSDTPEGVMWDKDIHGIARKYFQAEVDDQILPLQGSLTSIKWRLDGTKTENAFGWHFIDFEETMKQLIAQYLLLLRNKSE
jgi:nucleoside-diphosphate-sugar epimerase